MVQEIKGIVSGISYEKAFPRFLAAGILTILFHMFFLLFTPQKIVNNDHGKKKKYVSLLPVNTTLLSEKKLLNWMEIMNPTYAVCPDRKHGFSIDIPKKLPDDIPIEIKKHFLQIQRGNFLPLRIPEKTKFEKVTELWPYITYPQFKTVPELPKNYYPVLIPDNLNIQVIHFSEDEKKIIESIQKKNKVKILKPTILKVFFQKNTVGNIKSNIQLSSETALTLFPRIQILESCGDSDLDRIAVKKVSFSLSREKNNTDSLLITARWK